MRNLNPKNIGRKRELKDKLKVLVRQNGLCGFMSYAHNITLDFLKL